MKKTRMTIVGKILHLALSLCILGSAVGLPAPARAAGSNEALAAALRWAASTTPKIRLDQAALALANNPALMKSSLKGAAIVALLRLARVFLTRPRLAQGPDEITDEEATLLDQALAPLFDMDALVDGGFEFGESLAVWKVAGQVEGALLARYAARGLPKKLLAHVASFGPVIVIWAVSNQVHDQIREGRWDEGITAAVVADLLRRVGKDVLQYLAVSLAFKVLGMGWRGGLTMLEATAAPLISRLAGSWIGAMGAKVWTVGSAVLGAAFKIALVMAVAYAVFLGARWTLQKMKDSSDREGAIGQRIQYLSQLEDLLRHYHDEGKAPDEVLLGGQEAQRLLRAYNTTATENDPWFDSKAELFLRLCFLNNEAATKLYEKLGKVIRSRVRLEGRASPNRRALSASTRQEAALRKELRTLFHGEGGRSFFGGKKIPEVPALEAELERLESLERSSQNMLLQDEGEAEFTRFMGSYVEVQARHNETVRSYGNEPGPDAELRIRDDVDDFLQNWRSERLLLKSYIRERLAQIAIIEEGPTREEAMAERNLSETIFLVVKELLAEARDGFGETRLGTVLEDRNGSPASSEDPYEGLELGR